MSSSVAFLSDVIPETLLALAKDERYVRQCHELLKAILPGDSCPAGLSWLLYSLLVVRRTHKTLGMEFCGLSVTNTTTTTLSSSSSSAAAEAVPGVTKAGNDANNNRLWKLMALSAVVSMAIEWHFSKPDQVQATDATASNALRGRERQLFHQRQRQAMLQRATETVQEESSVVSPSTGHSSIPHDAESGGIQFRALLRKLKDVAKSTLLDLSVSTVAQEGPHRIVTTRPGTESLSKWIIRLAMVRFLIYGNFPIWNLFGIRLKKDHNNLLSNRPNLHRFVALLYLQQAATAGLLGVVQAMTKFWVQRSRRRNVPQTLEVPDNPLQLNLPTDMSCGICKLPRSDPAISSNCGHVFCWKCLYQWTSTVRQECPLCRTSCRPQEMMALYRYSPS